MNTDLPSAPDEAMFHAKGRYIGLSLPRRWICDLLFFAKRIPTVPVQRRCDLRPVFEARARMQNRPTWLALFTRAYALVAQETPELRRYYQVFPWPHLYEFPYSIASVAIERDFRGENAVFFAHLRSPETQTISSLERYLRDFKEKPVESFGLFRRCIDIARLPKPCRLYAWWYALNVGGAKRAKRIGTFGISAYSGLGAESLHPIGPLTTTLNWGVIEDGQVTLRIIYDHRVMDGSTVARALGRLEEVMNNEVAEELSTRYPKAA